MESNSMAATDERQKIMLAANWKTVTDIDLFNIDPGYHAFVKVIEYRRNMAVRLLESKDEKEIKLLNEVFKHCNKQIADILGLDCA